MKNTTLYVCPSHKIIVQVLCRFWEACSAVWRFSWERKLSQDRLYVSRWPSTSCPPPHLSADIRGELYKLSPEDSSVLGVAVGWFCDTLVFTSSSSASATTSPIYITHWGGVSWLFFRLSLCLFLSRSLSFLGRLCPPLMQSSLLPSHHENHPIWVDSSLMAPLELSSVF
jgi:hypothetical protein